MTLAILDPRDFTDDGLFSEDRFLARVDTFDFSTLAGQNVLVRGCSTLIPPWAFMLLTARLIGIARSIRYGNEHDNITVYRAPRETQKPVAPREPND